MSALEYRVVTRLLREGSFMEALSNGLKAEHFKDGEAKQIFRFMHQHWFNPNTAKTLPTIGNIKRRWPSFEPTGENAEEDGQLPALINELKHRAFESDTLALANYFQELAQEDPEEAVKVVKASLADLAFRLEGNKHLNILGISETAKQHYEDAITGAIYGIPWPWDCLTEDTLGKSEGEFIMFYGRMKSMKTWVMLHCAVVDYLLHNRRVFIWSKEMSEDQLALRCASLIAKVDYQLFKKGRLPPRLRDRAFATLAELTADRHQQENVDRAVRDIIIRAGHGAPRDIESLRGALIEHKPDIVYLDSFYHLRTDRATGNQRWSQIATLAEDIKALAQELRIPIVVTHQANREGEKLPSGMIDIADSDAIAREADLIIRIIMRKGRELHEDDYEGAKNEPKRKRRVGIRLPSKLKIDDNAYREHVSTPRVGAELALVMSGNREGVLEAFTIHAVPGYNFKIIEANFSSEEVKKWVDEDNKAKTPGAKGGTSRKISASTVKKMLNRDDDK